MNQKNENIVYVYVYKFIKCKKTKNDKNTYNTKLIFQNL